MVFDFDSRYILITLRQAQGDINKNTRRDKIKSCIEHNLISINMEQAMKGRGSQIQVKNRFLSNEYTVEHIEGVDVPFLENDKTQYIAEHPKKIVNKVFSSSVPFRYSILGLWCWLRF